MINKWSEIRSAKRRCQSMGLRIKKPAGASGHYLAACMSNAITMIGMELQAIDRDNPGINEATELFVCVLVWIHRMARMINEYCDTRKVVGDECGQYWMGKFLDYCDIVADSDCLG